MGTGYIDIDYDALDKENKKIIEEGKIPGEFSLVHGSDKRIQFQILVPCNEEDTVGIVSDRFMAIVSKFQKQDLLYGKTDVAEMFDFMTDHSVYSEDLQKIMKNGTFEQKVDLVLEWFPEYVYDKELHVFWHSRELYNKHLQYIKEQEDKEKKDSEQNISIDE